jgi:NTP pyrophosphatase (non-canonical NTP hydrolase)
MTTHKLVKMSFDDNGKLIATDEALLALGSQAGAQRVVDDLRADISGVWKTPTLRDAFHWTFLELGELGEELARLPGYMDVVPARNHPRESSLDEVAEEAADVLIMLSTVCSLAGINLQEALMKKVGKLRDKFGGDYDCE